MSESRIGDVRVTPPIGKWFIYGIDHPSGASKPKMSIEVAFASPTNLGAYKIKLRYSTQMYDYFIFRYDAPNRYYDGTADSYVPIPEGKTLWWIKMGKWLIKKLLEDMRDGVDMIQPPDASMDRKFIDA